jgi:hypothetical protein
MNHLSKDRMAETICRELLRQHLELDNAGDGQSILILSAMPVVNVHDLLDAIFAEAEIEVEWEE